MVVIPLIGPEFFYGVATSQQFFHWVGLLILTLIHIFHSFDSSNMQPDASDITLSDLLWWLVTLNYGLIYVLCLHIWVKIETSKLMNWKPFKGKNNE